MTSTDAQISSSAPNFAALFGDRVPVTPNKDGFRDQDHVPIQVVGRDVTESFWIPSPASITGAAT
ncbi:hypothetical protein, partial [Mycobacterium sp.]|uniref:hypothetical protein n=1 Tax=Mycobacterium sp. TaxID=1785 RepID=UPI0031D10ACE